MMSRLAFPHDNRTAQLADYARVHSRLFGRTPRDITGDQLVSTLVEGLALVYGMRPSALQTVSVGSGPTDDANTVIDLVEGRLWIRLPKVGYNATLSPVCAAASRPGSDWASLPLAPKLRDVARALHVRKSATSALALFPEAVRKIGQPIARLARSVPGWLTRCGLPGVLAHLLTGELDYTAHLATSAYINVSEQRVTSEHAEALGRFEALIAMECKRCELPFASALTTEATAREPERDRQFGSRIVPVTARVQHAVRALEARRNEHRLGRSLAELVRAWNVNAVYSWIRLSWAAALRPCRDPVVGRGDIDLDEAWIFVRDKHSPFSRESRLVPLPVEEAALLGRLAHEGDQLRIRLRAMTRTVVDGLAEKVLFFIIRDGRARPLTPELVRGVLDEEGLGELFPWPLNAPRHWLTRALELKMPLAQIEPFLGHLHEPVPWGQFSLVSLEQWSEPTRQLATLLLREVGFRAA